MKVRPAIWGHDFETSGEVVEYMNGEKQLACKVCRWPFDEHPNHPSRKLNRHIIAVSLADKRDVWG